MKRERGYNLSEPAVQVSREEKRLERFAERRQESKRMVFVVRLPAPAKGFGWEIRRFGNIVLSRSGTVFDTVAEAQAAGQTALAEHEV